ncbi:MAG: DUF4124 domain-containing protein [Oleibacter sp.]|nr:DUF4124 domain-containing protein [Thalassolituus sp.]
MPIFILFMFFVSLQASAGIYKWIDDNGVTHFSSTKPAEVIDAENVQVYGSANSSNANQISNDNDSDFKYEKPISDEAQDVMNSVKEYVSTVRDEPKVLDCNAAVKYAKSDLDYYIESLAKNRDDGYVSSSDYKKTADSLGLFRKKITLSQCNSASGDVRRFYICLSNGQSNIVACAKKYNIE